MSSDLYLPIFAGQGTSVATSSEVRLTALADASSSSGSMLLSTCHAVFHKELSSLSTAEFRALNIDMMDFPLPKDLLLSKARYQHNAVMSGSTIFLLQSLRYLAFVEATSFMIDPQTPFGNILKGILDSGTGILGFSSGVLPACVVATSSSTFSYITKAVEAYRLALWIGIRCHLFRINILKDASLDLDTDLPWSLVFMGMSRVDAEESITSFTKEFETAKLYITAIMNDTCVTISGRPDVLSKFSTFVTTNVNVVVHKTALDTLYHSPLHTVATRNQVMRDVASRNIAFPEFSDMTVPIRSTSDGDLITKEREGSLVEAVVDMILVHPVNWSAVIKGVLEVLPQNKRVKLLNVGPGRGLTRSTERAFPHDRTSIVDMTSHEYRQTQPKQEAIAIIGMAVNMPGAPNVSKLWEILEKGINTVSEIPRQRFQISDYIDGANGKRTMKARTGNFIDGADEFDNTPREAKSMDPQQRVLLHTAYEALEDSGYVPNSTPTNRPENFGCYIGVATHDYIQNLRDDIDVYYSPGTLKAFLSGRISYAMQLGGPSIVVDTACSSSNVALYQGARALMNRDCDSALVGGVNIITSPDMFLGLDRGHFLSPTGQCKAFDASADGYSRGEGCGVFILKRLSDAIAENDRILGVIRGIEVNQSGLAHSITHPHAPTQVSLFRRLLEASNVDPSRVNVIEAHGTGTQAGDPNELESIRGVFSAQRYADNPLHVTSIKANIGHLEAASGSAGLAKLLLMLQHRTIPPQISFKTLNPRIPPLHNDHTVIDAASAPWLPAPHSSTRLALLNNFGAAGSNSAVLVEEYQRLDIAPSSSGMTYFVFGLSAKDNSALERLRLKYLDFLDGCEKHSFADIAYSMTARRQIYNHRLAVSARTIEDLRLKLRRALPVQTNSQELCIAFVFSGQGGQYLGMGRSLYRSSQLFRSYVDECHTILIDGGFPGVLAIIDSDCSASGLGAFEELEAYQASIFALQYALGQLWISWGISPSAVVGHSLGEYAALVIAGVISVKDALYIVANRVRLMVRNCAVNETGMIAVNLGPVAVHDVLRASPEFSNLTIACFNSSVDCVLSGSLATLKAFKEYLDTEIHCKSTLLPVPFGYHSRAMSPLIEDLNLLARRVTLHPPNIPIVSNLVGDVVFPGDASFFTPEYFSRHCSEAVQFDKGIQNLFSNPSSPPINAWIEIGPHTTSLPMLKANPSLPRGTMLLGSLRKQQDGWDVLTGSLAQLYVRRTTVRWRDTFSHLKDVSYVSLPSYPFSPSKFWVEYQEPRAKFDSHSNPTSSSSSIINYEMLDSWIQRPSMDNENKAIFETPIKKIAGWINGHTVGGLPLCPASVYIELALSSIYLACSHINESLHGSHVVLRKLAFVQPLVYDASVDRTVVTTVVIHKGSGTFSIASRVSSSNEEIHAHGEYSLLPMALTSKKFSRTLPTISRYMSSILKPPSGVNSEVFSTRTAYEVIFPRVVDYSKEYHTMKSITLDSSSMEGCADVQLPADYDRGKFAAHPIFTDTLLHVAGFVANLQGGPNDAFICCEIGAVKIISEVLDYDASYTIYCSNAWVPEDEMVIADAYAILCGEQKHLVAHIKGMQFRRVRLDKFKKGLSRQKAAPSNPSSPSFKADRRSPSSSVHSTIVKIVAEACDLDAQEVDLDVDLASLGVDSLMSIEIFSRLNRAFPNAYLSSQTLSFCTTLSDIIQEVSSKANPGDVTGSETPITTMSGASTPRTLVPEDSPSQSTKYMEIEVKDVLSSVLDLSVHEIDDDADLEDLGLDSLTSIEALHAFRTEFGLELSNNLFTSLRTPRALQTYLSSQLSKPSTLSSYVEKHEKNLSSPSPTNTEAISTILRLNHNPLLIQSSNSGRHPLFLLHDGSGLVNYYERLSSLNRSVWAIYNPNFTTSRSWESVQQMAKVYAHDIAHSTVGPVLLGGWSFGGVAAYEVGRHLELMGRSVLGILLIDAPSPIAHIPLSEAVIGSVLNFEGRSTNSEIGRLMKAQFSMNSRLLCTYKPEPFLRDCPPMVMLRSQEGYNPPGIQVPAWLSDRSQPKTATAQWETLSKSPIEILDIPGHHFEPFHHLNIETVSNRIAEACERLERM
ncbi:Type I Iterative PKS [Tricholoma furcatifolium]|nr:Type I Iterative PKS [Tricholoma furcatifolium]